MSHPNLHPLVFPAQTNQTLPILLYLLLNWNISVRWAESLVDHPTTTIPITMMSRLPQQRPWFERSTHCDRGNLTGQSGQGCCSLVFHNPKVWLREYYLSKKGIFCFAFIIMPVVSWWPIRTSVVDSEGLPSYRNKLSLSPVSFFDSQAGCHDHCSYVERYIELAIRPAEMGNKCRQSLQILQKLISLQIQ